MGILNADRFSPTLFVGLGGSGSKVVNLIAGKLRRHPNFSRFRDLIHAVCVDTNKADLEAQRNVPRDNRFLVSAFDRRSYIARKRGKQELREDPMVTQWVHPDYQFREAQGAGAGQIRVESRLGLYYNVEEDRAGILRAFKRMLDAATRPDNAYRDNEDRVVNVMVYGSVAGGTGSGGFLPMAYLLQDLVRDHGWGRPNVVGTLLLPSVFTADVEQALHADIDANGYAALKELEHLTKLSYERYVDEIEFHYDPTHPERTRIHTRPFSLCYIVDKPSELSVQKYINAIADSSFLQVFSPIVGAQAGAYDNYDKHQKTLALDHFAVQYGSFGAAILVLPRGDILHYSALRYVHRVIDEYLVFGKSAEFRVPYDDPKFQRASPAEKGKIVDELFVRFADHNARLESEREERGAYTEIREQKAVDGKSLREAFRLKLQMIFDGLDEQIKIEAFDPTQVYEGNTSLSRSIGNLRNDLDASRKRVMGSYLQTHVADVKSGRLLSDFFRDNKVGPLAQRYFLVKLKDQGPLGPFEDPEDSKFLHETTDNRFDLDAEHMKREVADLEKRLRETSQRGFVAGLLARDNKPFEQVKRKVQDLFDQTESGQRMWMKATFWQQLHAELQRAIEARLTSFRNVSQVANETARNLLEEAERLRVDPASTRKEASDASEFYLDSEVLRDDRGGQRLWNRFFSHKLDRGAHYDQAAIFAALTAAFQPAQDKDGKIRARDANEIVRELRAELEAMAKDKLGGILDDIGFNLKTALELEARYVATPGAKPEDDEALDKVDARTVSEHVRDKFKRLSEQCVLLANIDKSKLDDPSVVPAHISYVGLAKDYASDEPDSLKAAIQHSATSALFIEWGEEDLVVFYRAMLGIPLYFYKRVNDELYHHYLTVKAETRRSYPLHIESTWEHSLPNLEPKELRAAEEKRRAEAEAQERLKERESRIWDFVLATLSGGVQKAEGGGWEWVVGPVRKKLAGDRALAFHAFWALDPALRDDLVAAGERTYAERTSTPPGRRTFRAELEGYLKSVSEQFALALAMEDEAQKNHLRDEKRVVEQRVAALAER